MVAVVTVPASDAPITVDIPPQSGVVVTVAAGHRLKIVDVEGAQVADMFAVAVDDPDEWLSASVTRACSLGLFPAVGGAFFSSDYRPMLTFERDDSPGVHDMLIAPCSPAMYQVLGCEGHHPNCSDNFRVAAAQVNWRPRHVPDPVNFFQHTEIGADRQFTMHPAPTHPGDSITLRAETAVHVVVTACSMDVEPINGSRCTSLRIELEIQIALGPHRLT